MRRSLSTTLCLALGLIAAAGLHAAPAAATASSTPSTAGATPPASAATPAAPAPPPAATGGAADPRLEEATSLVKRGKFKEAIAKLEACHRDAACPPRALTLLGILYVKSNRPKEALAVLKPLADAKDAQPAELYNAGLAAVGDKQPALAEGYFTRAALLQPASPASRELGLLRAHQGRVVEAYSMLRPWSLRNPADGEARLTAVELALDMERPADAEQLIAGMDPADPGIALMRGKILVQKGDGKGAVEVLTPLLSHHPEGMESEVRLSLAEADLLAGQPAQAVELLKGRVNNRPMVALALARAQHTGGDLLGALVTLRPFADQLPANATGLGDPRPPTRLATEYGRLLIDAGRSPEAVAVLEKATHILPQDHDAWKVLSQAYGAAGRRVDSQMAAAKADEIEKASLVGPGGAAKPAPAGTAPAPPAHQPTGG